MDESKRQGLLSKTRVAATTLLDDLSYIRRTIEATAPYPDAGDVRRLSNLLRRILFTDLVPIAAPRIGKISLNMPDAKPFIVSNRTNPLPLFSLLGAPIFGTYIAAVWQENSARPRLPNTYNPGSRVELTVGSALKQSVICLGGKWITRGEVIKYIANVAGGVHSSHSKNDTERRLMDIRYAGSVTFSDQMPIIQFGRATASVAEKPIDIDPSSIDFVLLELFSTAYFMTSSPDVVRLEAAINDSH